MIHLNWRTILATALMTTAVAPVAGATDATADVACAPVADASATPLPTDPVSYERHYTVGKATIIELWKEANGAPGLQPDPTWNCDKAPDVLVQSTCLGCATRV